MCLGTRHVKTGPGKIPPAGGSQEYDSIGTTVLTSEGATELSEATRTHGIHILRTAGTGLHKMGFRGKFRFLPH